MQVTQNKITPYLWFDNNAEEAFNFYMSLFPGSRVISKTPGPTGKMFLGIFELAGQKFMAINAGPQFKFNEAISLYVDCEDQEEVDSLWEKLTADGGEESMCGWLKDKYGLSWQIVPRALGELMSSPDQEKSKRVMDSLLQMKKIDLATLEKAYEGK